MGGVVVLHPQGYLKDQLPRDNLFSTPMKSRRSPKSNPNPSRNPNFNPIFTRSDGRKRSPADPRPNNRTPMIADPLAVAKNLVMGQVKILKRGELLNDSKTTRMKDSKMTPLNDSTKNDKIPKKKVEKVKFHSKVEDVLPLKDRNKDDVIEKKSKVEKIKDQVFDDLLLSTTDRLGPDPEMVTKQINNIADFFAGSGFVDSPPPSSLPLPGFFTKKFVKDDATTDLRRILGLNLS